MLQPTLAAIPRDASSGRGRTFFRRAARRAASMAALAALLLSVVSSPAQAHSLHGYTLDSRMWDEQARFFKKYRVIAPDMRFHGRSAAPEDSAFDAAEAAEDVRA